MNDNPADIDTLQRKTLIKKLVVAFIFICITIIIILTVVKSLYTVGDGIYGDGIYGAGNYGDDNDTDAKKLESELARQKSEELFELGDLYFKGKLVEQNIDKAMGYYQNAAETGNPDAQYLLASIYDSSQNYEEALKWYTEAGKNGIVDAMFRAGQLYETGKGIKQDSGSTDSLSAEQPLLQAEQWYKKAAEKRHPLAVAYFPEFLFKTAQKFENGEGLPKNIDHAAVWYQKAADFDNEQDYQFAEHNPRAAYLFAEYTYNKERTKKYPNYAVAARYYQIAADHDNLDAKYKLGLIYETSSYGLTRDKGKAIEYYKSAAYSGHSDAQLRLGQLYMYQNYSDAAKHDCQTAIDWYNMAAEHGNAAAEHELAIMYYYGNGCHRQDTEKGISLFIRSASHGYGIAWETLSDLCLNDETIQETARNVIKSYIKTTNYKIINNSYIIADSYYYGKCIDKNYKEALKYYKIAAQTEIYGPKEKELLAESQYMIGMMYDKGHGVAKNTQQAIEWYTKAAKNGNMDAHYAIGQKYENGDGVPKDILEALVWYSTPRANNHDPSRTAYERLIKKNPGLLK